jgi:dienelactone hydrolase
LAIGDFNGDGKADLAMTDANALNVSILLSNGDGTFKPPVSYPAGNPNAVVTADFNGDGKLDLAVADNNGPKNNGAVAILLGNGDGTFKAAVNYSAGLDPNAIAVGDFNGDGKLDVVVANYDGADISILLGNGDGTFQPATNYSTGSGSEPLSVAIGDFNHDGNPDLVVGIFNALSVFLGNGDGTFQPAVNYNGGGEPISVAVGDFNGDGRLDLAVTDIAGGQVLVLLGNGDGTFQDAVSYSTPGEPAWVALGDLNGDGKLDLSVLNIGTVCTVNLLLGKGDGTFQPAVNYSLPTCDIGLAAGAVGIGDFNRDGKLDLAVAPPGNSTFSVLLQAPTTSVSPTSLTFTGQVVGTRSSTQQIRLTNTGYLKLNIAGISISGTNTTDFGESNNCPSVLAIGATCTIEVTFAPTQIGPRTANVAITDNAPNSPQSVALSGIGVVTGPNVTLSTTSLSFSTQLVGTSSSAQTVTLNNYGSTSLSITSISVTGADPADFAETNNCGTSVRSTGSCTISVTFQPTQSGSRAASLKLTDNAPGSPQAVALSGTGTVVSLNPSSLSFQCNVNQHTCPPPPQSTTLTNTANSSLTINSITLTGQYFSETNNCPANVGPHKSCTITVSFTPPSFCGYGCKYSGAISVNDNGGGSPQQVTLTGNAKSGMGTAALSALGTIQDAAVPIPTGGSRVGTRLVQMVDSLRDDPFSGNATKRELMVRFWYPAPTGESCQPATYTSSEVWSYFSQLTSLPLPEVRTNSCLNAPVAEGSHPVVVFTHGYTGTFTDYTFLFEDLASRGYVVAAVDHTYEATAVEFPDGRLVKSVFGSHLSESTWRRDEQSISEALSVRLKDMTFVVDQLNRLTRDAHGPFAARFDVDKVAVAGHSLGGLTALLSAKQEPRFKAAILLDASLTDGSANETNMPVLAMTMGRTQWTDEECRLWSDLRGPRLAVNLVGAEHTTPSDAVWLAKGAIKTGAMGPDKTIAAVRDYVAAFLDASLRGKPFDRLLTGPSSNYPDAAVTAREQALCRQP